MQNNGRSYKKNYRDFFLYCLPNFVNLKPVEWYSLFKYSLKSFKPYITLLWNMILYIIGNVRKE